MASTDTTLRSGFALRLGRLTLTWPVLVLGAVVALFVLFNYPGFTLLME